MPDTTVSPTEDQQKMFDSITMFSTVYYRNRFGQQLSGRAVMRGAVPGTWVLNVGGPHGTPAVVNAGMLTKVTPPRRRQS